MKTKQKNKEKFYKVTGVLLALLLLASVLMLIFMPKVEEQNYFPSFVRFNDVIKQDTNLHWPCPIFDTVKQIKSDTSMELGSLIVNTDLWFDDTFAIIFSDEDYDTALTISFSGDSLIVKAYKPMNECAKLLFDHFKQYNSYYIDSLKNEINKRDIVIKEALKISNEISEIINKKQWN